MLAKTKQEQKNSSELNSIKDLLLMKSLSEGLPHISTVTLRILSNLLDRWC
jgi:hypothetical protein